MRDAHNNGFGKFFCWGEQPDGVDHSAVGPHSVETQIQGMRFLRGGVISRREIDPKNIFPVNIRPIQMVCRREPRRCW